MAAPTGGTVADGAQSPVCYGRIGRPRRASNPQIRALQAAETPSEGHIRRHSASSRRPAEASGAGLLLQNCYTVTAVSGAGAEAFVRGARHARWQERATRAEVLAVEVGGGLRCLPIPASRASDALFEAVSGLAERLALAEREDLGGRDGEDVRGTPLAELLAGDLR